MKSLLPHPAGSEVPDLSAVRRPAAAPTHPKVPTLDVLAWLRAAGADPAAFGMRRPAPPAPRVDHFAQALTTTRTVRRLAAVYDALADEAEALLAELAALAPFVAQVQKAGAEQ